MLREMAAYCPGTRNDATGYPGFLMKRIRDNANSGTTAEYYGSSFHASRW
jgi:hypothetical protein